MADTRGKAKGTNPERSAAGFKSAAWARARKQRAPRCTCPASQRGAAGLRGLWGGRSGRGEPGGNPGGTVACHPSFLSLPRPKEGQGRLTCFSYSCWSRARQGWSSPFAVASGCAGQGRTFHSCTPGGDRGRSAPLFPFPRPKKGQGAGARHSFHFSLFLTTWSQFPSLLPFPGCGVTRAVCPLLLPFLRPWKGQGPGAHRFFHSCARGICGPVPTALFLPAPVEELGAGPPITGCHQFGAGGEPWEPEQSSEPCPRCPPRPCLPMPGTHCVRVARQPSPPAGSSCRPSGRARQPRSQWHLLPGDAGGGARRVLL